MTEYYIPFKTDKKTADRIFRKKTFSGLLAKSSFNKDYKKNGLTPMYVPLWTNSIASHITTDASCELYPEAGKTEYYHVRREAILKYPSVKTSATKEISKKTIEQIMPYSFESAVEGTPDDDIRKCCVDITPNDQIPQIYEYIKKDIKEPSDMMITDFQSVYNVKNDVHFSHEEPKCVYVPTWKFQNKFYINGETGKASGGFPLSPIKCIIGSIALFILLFFISMLIPAMSQASSFIVNENETSAALFDDADIISDYNELELLERMRNESKDTGCMYVFITVNDSQNNRGTTLEKVYSDNSVAFHGKSVVMFLVNTSPDNSWCEVVGCNDASERLNHETCDYINNRLDEYVVSGEYNVLYNNFFNLVRDAMNNKITTASTAVNKNNEDGMLIRAILCIVLSLLIITALYVIYHNKTTISRISDDELIMEFYNPKKIEIISDDTTHITSD